MRSSGTIFGIRYINCGDWVESCTAVVEHPDGRFEIIAWTGTASDERSLALTRRLRDEDSGRDRCLAAANQRRRQRVDRAGSCRGAARSADRISHPPKVFRRSRCRAIPDIAVAVPRPGAVARRISAISPDAIHIATEGPIGCLVRRYCRARRLAVHHQLPHPLPRLPVRPPADSGFLGLALAATISRRGRSRDDGDAGHDFGA